MDALMCRSASIITLWLVVESYPRPHSTSSPSEAAVEWKGDSAPDGDIVCRRHCRYSLSQAEQGGRRLGWGSRWEAHGLSSMMTIREPETKIVKAILSAMVNWQVEARMDTAQREEKADGSSPERQSLTGLKEDGVRQKRLDPTRTKVHEFSLSKVSSQSDKMNSGSQDTERKLFFHLIYQMFSHCCPEIAAQ